MARLLYWAPRVLALLAAAFVGLFALDVFGEGYSLGQALLAFVIHLAPTWLILLALVVAWRWERLGAGLFVALALLSGIVYGAQVIWLLPAPLIVIGLLFLGDALYRRGHAQPGGRPA